MKKNVDTLPHGDVLEGLIEDLRLLMRLEHQSLNLRRLNVRNTIALQSLRTQYPGSSARFQSELMIGDHSEEDLLLYVLMNEDNHQDILRMKYEFSQAFNTRAPEDQQAPERGLEDPFS